MALTKPLVAFLLLYLIGGRAQASTACIVEDSGIGGIKTIAWNVENETAKVTDNLNTTHSGRVVLQQKHSKDGVKVNVYVKYEKPYYGDDAAEYIVFPSGNGQFRVIGITYVIRDNEKYFNALIGNFAVTCTNSTD